MKNRKLSLLVILGFVILASLAFNWPPGAKAQTDKVDFARDIAPIFAVSCAKCHGAEKQLSNLRLDDKKSAMRVIVAGKSADSRLIHRVLGLNNEARMPKGGDPLNDQQIALLRRWIDQGADWPENTAAEVKTKKHWAYLPPIRPALPELKNKTWARNAIDDFVLARLEKEGLQPSPEADRPTLLRRLSLDLIGLPPTPEEIDAFLSDQSPNAYEKQVERLLASPHYGEKWGRQWLDAARYADSDGYEKDKQRFVWFYRDWVINALNRDLPYDQFIIQQLAGDLLPAQKDPKATQDQIVATGFLRNSMINEEGGVDPEQFRMEAMFDRMEAIGKGILGITIQCAQCHNHKFDPIKQEEYYRLFAFLNNSHESDVAVYTPEQQMRRANILSQTREVEARLQEIKPDWMQQMNAWEERVRNDQPTWQIVQPIVEDISTGGARYLPQKDGSFLQSGYAPTKHRVKLTLKPEASEVKNITGFRLELLNDPNLPMNGPGRSLWGTAALTEFEVETAPADIEAAKGEALAKGKSATDKLVSGSTAVTEPGSGKPNSTKLTGDQKNASGDSPAPDAKPSKSKPAGNDKAASPDKGTDKKDTKDKKATKIKIISATADINPPETELKSIFFDKTARRRVEGPIEFAIDGKDETAWGIDAGPGQRNAPRKAVFVPENPVSLDSDTVLNFYLKQNHGGWNSDDNQSNNLGRFRLSITTAPNPKADPLPAGVREILGIPREHRSKAQVDTLFSYWRTTVPELAEYNQQIAAIWKQHPEGSSQLVLDERDEMRETHLLKRGDWLRPDRTVQPGVPAFLNPLPANAPLNRLTLARWMVDRQSPTTARSIVNRIWQSYFGTGLSATSEDLGVQSEFPSHPELLDWLAVELMEPSRKQGNKVGRGQGDWVGKGAQSSPAWSLKNVHRLIVNSATYRQASNVTPQLYEKDPYNRLLARGPRFRVEGEIVRDIALYSSGLLNLKVGGPSVFPPAPEFLFQPPVSYGPKPWDESKGADRYRRAIYTFRYRSVPYPMLQTFDAPNGDIACVRRARSNTPLQALTTLNETLFMEASRALALKTLTDGGASDAARLDYAFRRVLGRHPATNESNELLGLLARQQQRFASGEINPWNLATPDPDKPFPLPKGMTMERLAAWTAVSRVLLNLDETITKE